MTSVGCGRSWGWRRSGILSSIASLEDFFLVRSMILLDANISDVRRNKSIQRGEKSPPIAIGGTFPSRIRKGSMFHRELLVYLDIVRKTMLLNNIP